MSLVKQFIVSFARVTTGLCAILALSACTRTYDGSIVPEYTAYRVTDGWTPHYVYRKTDTEPRNRLIKFPPPPPPAEVQGDIADEAPARPAKRRQVRRQPVSAGADPSTPERKVTCRRDNSDAGRIRVICD
jgi:hypothetical protein